MDVLKLTLDHYIQGLIILALVIFIFALVYFVLFVREVWLSAKTARKMVEKVDVNLDPVLKDSAEIIGSVSTVAGVIATRMKQVLGVLDFVSLFTGGENRSDVLKKVIPSKKVFQSFLSGIKKGIEVMTAAKGEKKESVKTEAKSSESAKSGKTRRSKEEKNA